MVSLYCGVLINTDIPPDLMKFQMLCWTVVARVVYHINFFSQCQGGSID
ncbi:MAG: hypothetical protein ACOY40_02850 [Bacillota bacterium]